MITRLTQSGDATVTDDFPSYAFVPGGPWPHPAASHQKPTNEAERQAMLDRGIALFDAGYYWEAHELWEVLWHVFGRHGPKADVLKGLIKLAASGVKVREKQRHGVVTHASRAAETFVKARDCGGERLFGFDLNELINLARAIADKPPEDVSLREARVAIVFDFQLRRLVRMMDS